ncbi:Cytochrome bo(3) ubiquinol oxidase subunit 4 [Serratia symbiotica]|nr:Cytochrome bo(3) ubiquinol oxidase subunit 4 [Serratia symbiotica]
MSYTSHQTPYGAANHGSFPSYLIGFILSIILTAIPFFVVMNNCTSNTINRTVVIGSALIQMVVHIIYFLHINTSSKKRWNLVALMFTAIMIGILLTGSLWIMYNLNINMLIS